MANADKPKGFTIVGGPTRVREYTLAAANTAIGKGDLVTLTAAGVIDQSSASDTQIVGVALEPAAANSGAAIRVNDHPDTIYMCQTDASSGGGGVDLNALTAMNLNADIAVTAASNGISKMEIDQDSGATTQTLPLKVLRLHKAVDNEFGDYNRLEVIINNHVFKSVGVVGV